MDRRILFEDVPEIFEIILSDPTIRPYIPILKFVCREWYYTIVRLGLKQDTWYDIRNQIITDGHVECVRFMFDNGCRFPTECILLAATRDRVSVLDFFWNRMPILQKCTDSRLATRVDPLGSLRELLPSTCIKRGSIRCLSYLVSKKWPIDKDTIDCAIRHGRYDLLASLLENRGVETQKTTPPLSACIDFISTGLKLFL